MEKRVIYMSVRYTYKYGKVVSKHIQKMESLIVSEDTLNTWCHSYPLKNIDGYIFTRYKKEYYDNYGYSKSGYNITATFDFYLLPSCDQDIEIFISSFVTTDFGYI